jgi:RNA polymerase sigma factor (sigma-70 family)
MSNAPLPRLTASSPLGASPPSDRGFSDAELLARFVRAGDQSAFAALVRRHGPMVLGVCRRVLSHAQDAEDAFQATFLVLVRKAGTLGRPELLGNWLYGVAYRTARKARADAARRAGPERQSEPMSTADPVHEAAWRELRARLDEEINRLPDKYRLPVVLCYLEGKTNEEAARLLGWPTGSMSARLSRGRELLRERLTGRARVVPPGAFALLLAQQLELPTVPPWLEDSAVQSGLGWAGLKDLAWGTVPATAAELARRTLEAMQWERSRPATLGLAAALLALLLGAVAAYAGWPSRFLPSPGDSVAPSGLPHKCDEAPKAAD